MFQKRYYYLVKFQFLGYRFHGWQKQPKTKTLHLMIDRTLKYEELSGWLVAVSALIVIVNSLM